MRAMAEARVGRTVVRISLAFLGLIGLLAVFLALQPGVYRDGVIRLVPPAGRPRRVIAAPPGLSRRRPGFGGAAGRLHGCFVRV